MKIKRGLKLLLVTKDPNQANRVATENRRLFRGEFAAAQDETVDAFGALKPGGEQRFAERTGPPRAVAPDAQSQPDLDEFRNPENGLRRPVVVLHEVLHARQHFRLGIAQGLRDARLQVQVHDVGGAGTDKMQLVADPQHEVVGALKRRQIVRPKVVLGGEFGDRRDVELHPGHPDRVLVVAQAADAVLEVRFLVENGVRKLGAPVRLIVKACGDIALGVFADVVAPVGLREGIVELGRTGDESGLQECRFGLDILSRLVESVVNGTRRIPDFEATIPQDVENLVGQMLLQRLGVAGLRLGRKKEHDVDIAPRRQFAPPVAAQRDERDGGRQRAAVARIGIERAVEKVDEQFIDGFCAIMGDLQAGFASGVPRAQRGRFPFEKLLARGQSVGDGDFAHKAEAVTGVLMDVGGHGAIEERLTSDRRG